MVFSSPFASSWWLRETAQSFMGSSANDMNLPGSVEPAFGEPLIGFAAGDDPLWKDFKTHVGAFHWTPGEAFRLGYPDETAEDSELFVMSWILPQTEATCRDNSKQKDRPAERWARSRIFGEEMVNNGLRKHLLQALHAQNIQAVSPMLLPQWSRMDSETFVFSSTWSERHAAYAAGLGTFGLCDGLITPVGKAMRAGSIIIRLPVQVTERPYTHHMEYCLLFSSGTCGVCMRRCPVNAITEKGHDKNICKDFLRGTTAPYVEETWHFKGYGCGLCQVGVPCEKGIPPKPNRSKAE